MAAVSISLAVRDESHQATIGTSAPGAGAVELRIADGTSHEDLRRLMLELAELVRVRVVVGV